ncbi:hypothetical protein RUND412_004393 [Rhizina undulata]
MVDTPAQDHSKGKIIVLGAGVIGLQTALTLLERGYECIVVAKHWPGDDTIEYASMKAGAHWRTHAGPEDPSGQKWDAETYRHWNDLIQKEKDDAGLELIQAYYYWNEPTAETHDNGSNIWWRNVVFSFATIPVSALPPGVHFGVSYLSFCLNPATYLSRLLREIAALGGKLLKLSHEVKSLEDVFNLPGIAGDDDILGLVNCTGLGARELVGDDAMYPGRGQTILVSGEAEALRLRSGRRNGEGKSELTYTIRRPGAGTILGGSNDAGDWNPQIDEDLNKSIISRCAKLAPELLHDEAGEKKFRILARSVGRRPMRKGGPRIEAEWIEVKGRRKIICHHYGHGGAGYQNSVGSARDAVELIEKTLSGAHSRL